MTTEEQIINCEDSLSEAIKTSNIKILDELLHDDLIFNMPTGQTITKAMDIENYRSGLLTVHEFSTTDRIIKVIDNVSIVALTAHLKGKYADQGIDGTFRYLRVWKLFGGSWKIIAGSALPISSPETM